MPLSFGDAIPSKNLGPRSPMRKPSGWTNIPDPWQAPPPQSPLAAGAREASFVPPPAESALASRGRTKFVPPPVSPRGASLGVTERGSSVTAGASPERFASSPRRITSAAAAATAASAASAAASAASAASADAPIDDPLAEPADGPSTGALRYNIVCKRLYCLPDPSYTRTLDGEHDGEYSTTKAEVLFDPDGIFAIVSTLEMCRGLHTLRLAGLQRGGMPLLRTETLSAAMTAVRSMPLLRLFDLSSNALDDEIAAKPLGKLLKNNTNLTGLVLRSNYLSHASARALLSNLSSNRTLLELDTSDNLQLKWTGQALEYERLFKENATITSFGASLRPEPAASILTTFVRSPARMRRVALTMMPLGDEHIACICSWLASKQCALTDLDLSHASTDAGGARLSRALHLNRSLIKLSFAHNRMANTGGIAFAEALRANVTLTHASVQQAGCSLPTQGSARSPCCVFCFAALCSHSRCCVCGILRVWCLLRPLHSSRATCSPTPRALPLRRPSRETRPSRTWTSHATRSTPLVPRRSGRRCTPTWR